MNEMIICCWGDSVTEGMRMDKAHTYPAQLQKMLGEGFRVFNGGSGGERTETIMARRGARRVFLDHDALFAAGEKIIRLAGTDAGLVTERGEVVRLTAYLGMELSVNPVYIAGNRCVLSYENWNWTPISGDLMLARSEAKNELRLLRGTELVFESTDVESDVDIVFMGANGGYGDDVSELVRQHETFVGKCGRCLVIVPYFRQDADEVFEAAFGERAVNVRRWFCSDEAFEAAGLTKTDEDRRLIAEGRVPPAFTLSPGNVHLNEKGYEMLAYALAERLKKLGWTRLKK